MTGSFTQNNNTLPHGQGVSFASNFNVSAQSAFLNIEEIGDSHWLLETGGIKDELLLGELNQLFATNKQVRCVTLSRSNREKLNSVSVKTDQGDQIIWREMLLQSSRHWLSQEHIMYPMKLVTDKSGYHPIREVAKKGELYRRYIPELSQTLTLLGLEVDKHAELFSKWQNSPRVAKFWEQTGTLKEHIGYLNQQVADNKNQLMIACLDDEPFAYVEAYWTKEDRISPYYHAEDYDRGIHMLVGEEAHRGAHKVAAWLPSVCHYLYLADSRTQRIVSEPRSDNHKMIGYLQDFGFAKIKEFDFPHKRAALMCQLRSTFFEQCL